MIDPAGGAIGAWLSTGEPLELRVQSASMWPLIRTGDRVRIVPPSTLRIRVGDLVLIRRDERYVVHRVRRIGESIITRGDAAYGFDPPVDRDKIVGRIVAIERAGRWFTLPSGPVNVLVAAAAILLARTRARASRIRSRLALTR